MLKDQTVNHNVPVYTFVCALALHYATIPTKSIDVIYLEAIKHV